MPSTTPRSKKSAKKTETAMKLRSPSRWTFSRRSSSRARAKASSSRPRGSLATIVSSSQTDGPAGKRSRFDPLRAIHYLRFRTPAAVFGEGPRRTRVASGMDFPRIKRLPPYVFNVVGDLKLQARRAGEDIVDFSMGNPDGASPPHVVEKLIEAVRKPANHRYSVSRGIYKLRVAICDWYRRRFDVDLDPDAEAIVTMGSKEGIGHLALAMLGPGDVVFCPSPTYPIHQYSVIIAGGDLRTIPLMPGWRVGFMVGNREIVAALARVKSYLDYGIFQPVQIAATHALNGPQHYVEEICETYRKRRDVLCEGLDRIGWHVPKPKATMFVWAEIPDAYKPMGSLEFSKLLLREAKVAVSPGIGFGEFGDHYVRFALIENEHRTRQAVRGIRRALGAGLVQKLPHAGTG